MKNNEQIIEEAIDNFELAEKEEEENRIDFIASNDFSDGEQWPNSIKEKRKGTKRPMLVINKLRKFVLQILGEIQQNRPDLSIIPWNSSADAAGAQIRNILIKYIETISNADYAYDVAIQQALKGGWGYWRILTDYSNKSSFDQEIKISPVKNALSVFVDPYSNDQLGQDADWAHIITTIPKNIFRKEYGYIGISPFDTPEGMKNSDWYSEDGIRVSEYYWREHQEKRLLLLNDGNIIFEEEFKNFNNLEIEVIKERIIKIPKVYWVKMTQSVILEGPKEIAGEYIPIIKMVGYEHNDEGYTRYRSLIHDSLDSMRIYNYCKTNIAESIALAPKAPYLVTPEQIKGYKQMWEKANNEPYPYLLYNIIPGMAKPSREPPVPIPSAAITEAQMANSDINDVIGQYAPSFGEPSNERSGRAIIARQVQANNTVFQFINNFKASLIHTQNVILKMIPVIYDTQRIIRILGTQGVEELQVNYPNVNIQNLTFSIANDLTGGEYKVIPSTSPNYATKRQQKAASMLDFLQFAPNMAPILLPRIANLMDWEGAQAIAQEMQQLQIQSIQQQMITQQQKLQ